MSALSDLRAGVADVVKTMLADYSPRKNSRKLIRDPVSGFVHLEPHEIAIVDSPLFQRLRYIHQTALAYHVYPGAHHTRFEHSLGVAHRAEQMAEAINSRHNVISAVQVRELRLAGLLHDIGHGPFSHLSESIFSEKYAGKLHAIELEDSQFKGRGLGEILSYLVVTSDPFKMLLDDVAHSYQLEPFDVERIASYFVGGRATDNEQYLAEIISGPFDADKLDYFHRDCYYTGIRAEIDIERILSVIDIDVRSQSDKRHLVVRRAGVHHMEHIIFSKMLLFSSVYHHHKIRALECGVRSVFRKIWRNPSAISDSRLRFPGIESLLTLTEADFWTAAEKETELGDAVRALYRRREIPMRALVLNMATVETKPGDEGLAVKFQQLNEFPEKQREIGDTVYDMLDTADQHDRFGVWFDFPKTPTVAADAKKTIIDRGDEYVGLKEFFPTDDWVAAYTDNKLTAHVFYEPDEDARRAAGKKAMEYLKAEYDIDCKPIAHDMCFKREDDEEDEEAVPREP